MQDEERESLERTISNLRTENGRLGRQNNDLVGCLSVIGGLIVIFVVIPAFIALVHYIFGWPL